MAQKTHPGAYTRRSVVFTNSTVAVAAAGNATLAQVQVDGCETLGFYLTNDGGGAVALDAFIIQFRYGPGGTWQTVASAGADFTTPIHPVIGKTDDLTTLADAGVSHACIDVRGVYEIKILASAAAGGTTASIEGYAE